MRPLHLALTTIAIITLLIGVPSHAQGILPKLISERRIEEYLKYVELSEEQRQEILRLNVEYRASWDHNFSTEISVHNAKWNATYVREDQFVGDSMEESFREVLASQQRLRYRLQAANDEFFDQVELILTDQQLPRMQRVRLAHDRATYRRAKRPPRERDIDVVEMAENLPLSDDERNRLEAALWEIEPVFVQALREAAEADQRSGVFSFRALDINRLSNLNPDAAQQKEIDRIQDQGERVRLRSSRRLVEVIRHSLQSIKSVLSPEAVSELQRRYSEQAYPEIYPDPSYSGIVYDQALDLPDLDAAIGQALSAMKADYDRIHETLSTQFCKLLYDHSCIYFKYSEETMSKLQASHAKLTELALKREQLNLAQPPQIRALLTPEQNEQLKPWPYEKTQPPRPWARLAGLPDDTSQREREALRKAFEAARSAEPAPAAPR